MLTIKQIGKLAVPIALKYGITDLYLFGSYARGDANGNSDLDFRFDRPDGFSLFKMGGLQQDLMEAFHLPVDVAVTSQLNEKFLNEISTYEVRLNG